MRKNGSRTLTLKQYRLTDMFLFAVILIAFELILHYALIAMEGYFTFSPLLPIVLLVMMRWGWPSVFFAVGDGLLYCLLNRGLETFEPSFYAIYAVGNAFILLLLVMTRFMGKQRITEKWYFSVLFVVSGWIAVVLGRCLVSLCFGKDFVSAVLMQLSDVFSLAVGIIVILIMRRLDGMFEDQKHYLRRLDEERREKERGDMFGDKPVELDEESLAVLKKWDDNHLY